MNMPTIPLKTVFRLALPLLIAAGLSSCATPFESRVKKHPVAWDKLPSDEKVLAERGGIVKGMSKDGVFFSWGPPHRLSEAGGTRKDTEIWRYYNYVSVPTYGGGFGGGYGGGFGHGGFGRGGFGRGGFNSYCPGFGYGYYDFGPNYVQVPEESAKVEFSKGRVDRWETYRR